jgi:hypothetical protein
MDSFEAKKTESKISRLGTYKKDIFAGRHFLLKMLFFVQYTAETLFKALEILARWIFEETS